MLTNKYPNKYPNPPTFQHFQNVPGSFEVPKYYGFDHPCTKWILSSIVSNYALTRLLRVAFNFNHILKRYHQIPDIPSLVTKDRTTNDHPAFNNHAILYLNPLSIAIYLKYDDALTQLINLKNNSGKILVDPNELNFVQNFWRKGESRYFTDLITTYPAIIAIRRNYFNAFRHLLQVGYNPNMPFTIIYRKPHRELIICYKDLIDYVLDYLRKRPGFNSSKLMQVLLNSTSEDANILDIYSFDILSEKNSKLPDVKVVSLFLRVTKTALDEENLSDENGMHILNILEKIQEAGYFMGNPNHEFSSNKKGKTLEQLIKDSSNQKLMLKDIYKLTEKDIQIVFTMDYKCCVANLIIWYQMKLRKRKTEQTIHLLNLLTRVFYETGYIEWFFVDSVSNDDELYQKLRELPCMHAQLMMNTVVQLRYHISMVFQQNESLILSFMARYKSEPMKTFFGANETILTKTRPLWLTSDKVDREFRDKYIECKEYEQQAEHERNKSNFDESNTDFINNKIFDVNLSNPLSLFNSCDNNADQLFHLFKVDSKTFERITYSNKAVQKDFKIKTNKNKSSKKPTDFESKQKNQDRKLSKSLTRNVSNQNREWNENCTDENFCKYFQSEVILDRKSEHSLSNKQLTTIEIDVMDNNDSKATTRPNYGSITQVFIANDNTAPYEDDVDSSNATSSFTNCTDSRTIPYLNNKCIDESNSSSTIKYGPPPPLKTKKLLN